MLSALALEASTKTPVNLYTFRHSACRWLRLSGQSTIMVEAIMERGSEQISASTTTTSVPTTPTTVS
jgi:hypothetical protein